jgi:hypothetical protein
MDMTAHDDEHGVPLLGEALPDENSAPIGASVLSSSINLYDARLAAVLPLPPMYAMPEARGEPPRRLNTLVGAGMLALPYAFAVQGWAVGMTTLLLAAFGSATGQMLLSVCAQRLHSRSTSYGACTRVPTARFHWVLIRSATLLPAALHHRRLLRCAACFTPPALKPELACSASPSARTTPRLHWLTFVWFTLPTCAGALASVALPRLTYAIDAAVAIKCFGVATSYLLVIGDQMPSVVRSRGYPPYQPRLTCRGLEASPCRLGFAALRRG